MSEAPARPPSIASLLATALLVGIACSFAYYGLLRGYAPRIGWPWYAGWVLAILLPPFAYLTVKRGGPKAALGPYMLFLTPGLLLGLVFPFALL